MSKPRASSTLAFLLVLGCGDDATTPSGGSASGIAIVMGGPHQDVVADAAYAPGGGLRVVTGWYDDTLQISGSDTQLSSARVDGFLVAIDDMGDVAWGTSIGGNGFERFMAIARREGGFYVAGHYIFDTNIANTELVGHGLRDVLLINVNEQGDPLWAVGAGSSELDDVQDVAVMGDGAIVCGYAGRQFTWGGQVIGLTDRATGFVVRVDATGNPLWSTTMTIDFTSLAASPDGTVYACGAILDDPGAMMLHFNDLGQGVGGSVAIGVVNSAAWDMVVLEDRVVVACTAAGPVDFDLATDAGLFTEAGSWDAYVASYAADGTFLWARQIGSAEADWATGLCVVGNNDVVVAGTFEETIRLGHRVLRSQTGHDVFRIRFDSSGQIVSTNVVPIRGSFVNIASDGASTMLVGGVEGPVEFPFGEMVDGYGVTDGFVYED